MFSNNILDVFKIINEEIDKIPEESRRRWTMKIFTEGFEDKLPKTLLEILAAFNFKGDSGLSFDVRPEWLDMEKFYRGQKFAMEHLFSISYVELMSMFMFLSFDSTLKSMIVSGNSCTPYASFKRFLSSILRIQSCYASNPWVPGTPAYQQMKFTRRMHEIVRKREKNIPIKDYTDLTKIKNAYCPAINVTRQDFQSTCPAPQEGQCPYTILGKFPNLRQEKLNQGDMMMAQFIFVALPILSPKSLGIHDASHEDLEAFCHVWRSIGYLLGIEDEFNICRGSLEDVKTRSRDYLEKWVKPNLRMISPEYEHVMRCIVEGLCYYVPGFTYEIYLLHFADILDLQMPKLYNTISYLDRTKLYLIKFGFNYLCKFSIFYSLMNIIVKTVTNTAKRFSQGKHKEFKEKSMKMVNSWSHKLS